MQKQLFLLVSCFIFGSINAMDGTISNSEKMMIGFKLAKFCDHLTKVNLCILAEASNQCIKLREELDKQKENPRKRKRVGLAPKPSVKKPKKDIVIIDLTE